MRESDTGLWLHNKLGATDELWAPPSIASLLTAAVIDNIRLCFHGLSSAVKLKLLLGTLHLPRRAVDEVRRRRAAASGTRTRGAGGVGGGARAGGAGGGGGAAGTRWGAPRRTARRLRPTKRPPRGAAHAVASPARVCVTRAGGLGWFPRDARQAPVAPTEPSAQPPPRPLAGVRAARGPGAASGPWWAPGPSPRARVCVFGVHGVHGPVEGGARRLRSAGPGWVPPVWTPERRAEGGGRDRAGERGAGRRPAGDGAGTPPGLGARPPLASFPRSCHGRCSVGGAQPYGWCWLVRVQWCLTTN